MVCLDTTFLVDVLRGSEQAKEVEERLAKQHAQITVAAPSVMELVKGLYLDAAAQNVKEQERSHILDILSSFVVLSLDQRSAILAGEIEAMLVNNGLMLDVEDIMIAAIAITHGEPLITRNTKHFERIPNLNILNY